MSDKFPDMIELPKEFPRWADVMYLHEVKDGIFWLTEKRCESDVQYIRTDVARGAYRQEMKAEIVKWLSELAEKETIKDDTTGHIIHNLANSIESNF